MSQNKTVAVVGGGFAGLLAAWLLSEQSHTEVLLVEQASELGGLLRSHNFDSGGTYDHGAHNVSESGIPDLDQKLRQLMTTPDWQILEGNRRDLAGVYVNGKLQTETQFINLNNWPLTDKQRWLGDFFVNLQQRLPSESFKDAKTQLEHNFGPLLSQELFEPLLQGLYQRKPEDLHPLALNIVPMSRFAAFSGEVERDILSSDLLRRHIAFSQQRELPSQYASGLASFYPVKPGIGQWVDLIKQKLDERKVRVLTGTQLTQINRDSQGVNSLELCLPDGTSLTQDVQHVFWSAGIPPLARQLGISASAKLEPPIPLALCHLLLSEAPLMEDLYYFYCLDRRYHLFRACHYTAYCPQAKHQAKTPSGYPMTVEIFTDARANPDTLLEQVQHELKEMGILTEQHRLLFGQVKTGQQGLPVPSVSNLQIFDELRAQLHSLKLQNLELLGLMAEEAQTFQRDIMRDTYHKVQNWLKQSQQQTKDSSFSSR